MDRAFMDEYYDKMRADDIEELSSQRNEDYSDRADDYKAAKQELKIEKLCFDKYCTCFGRTGYIQSFVPKNSMEFLIILVEKFGLK